MFESKRNEGFKVQAYPAEQVQWAHSWPSYADLLIKEGETIELAVQARLNCVIKLLNY